MIQTQLQECFSVASAVNPERRYNVRFLNGSWTCDCQFFNVHRKDCRHILEKRLETKTRGLFDGDVYEPLCDEVRLTRQLLRIWDVMVRGEWLSLGEIGEETGDPTTSISAQLRHLRKKRFGQHLVDKRRRGCDSGGLWEYRLVVNDKIRMVKG